MTRLTVIDGGAAPRRPSRYMQGRDAGYAEGYATARADMAEVARGMGFLLLLTFAAGICAGLLIAFIWNGSV